jgi:site-specific DNA-adenine methylase
MYGIGQGIHMGMDAYAKNRTEKQQQQLAQVANSIDDQTIISSIDNDPSIAAALAQMKQ